MQILNNIKVVLVEPTHPGNIGAVARAMMTMGIVNMALVNPKKFPHYEASKRAAGAESVLDNAQVVDELAEALSNCTMILGTSVRDREVSWPTVTPPVAAVQSLQHLTDQPEHQIALLFGRESSGLTNAELDLCKFQVRIPANPDYSSLNLASAVQIICYELRAAALEAGGSIEPGEKLTRAKQRQQAASQALLDGHIEHLQQVLEKLDFIKSKPPTMLMRKLTRLYNKAELTVEEIQILRGILSAIEQRDQRS